MRSAVYVFIAALISTNCAHLDIKRNIEVLQQIQPGDTQEQVFQMLGHPDLRNDVTDRRFVVFYQTKASNSIDEPVTQALCTPVAFENGQVVAIGQDLTDAWTREESQRQRRATIAERERRQAEAAATTQYQSEADRLRKIEALEKAVGPVPPSNAALNLTLYRQLLDLAPDNSRYRKKVALYEERLASQEKARQKRAALAVKEKRKRAWENARVARNKSLRQYTGNGTAEMAVHDMGQGSLYVWVKNISSQIITTHPDNFSLIDSENHKTECKISETLDSVLEPGSISHGRIEYDQEIEPKELIFQNRESGRIGKSFR